MKKNTQATSMRLRDRAVISVFNGIEICENDDGRSYTDEQSVPSSRFRDWMLYEKCENDRMHFRRVQIKEFEKKYKR